MYDLYPQALRQNFRLVGEVLTIILVESNHAKIEMVYIISVTVLQVNFGKFCLEFPSPFSAVSKSFVRIFQPV